MRTIPNLLLFALAFVALSGCDKPLALGDANSILIAAPEERWEALEPVVREALEPRTLTVRDEEIFQITYANPAGERWSDFRKFRNLLLVGTVEQPWIEEALEEVPGEIPPLPAIITARNVWAQNQQVRIVLLPPGAEPGSAAPLLEQVGAQYLEDYEKYARARMFATGADTALADTLVREAGFRLLLPELYQWGKLEEGVYLFRNTNPSPAELIRSVLVARAPAEVAFTPEALLEWRREAASRYYSPPQVTGEVLEVRRMTVGETEVLEVQGVWSNPPEEWPAAGPFLARLVRCPGGRTFYLDAWLYAPGKDKYEYMIQLRTILNSFRCPSETGTI